MERAITFRSGNTRLEGRLYRGAGENAAAIAHPHPQMGGDMENPVVKLAAEAYRQAGWTTLRFNFRGVGRSEGAFDHGNGEQLDLQAAIGRLRVVGGRRLDVVGYSFGAWIAARWARSNPSHGQTIVLVAPPVDFLEFGTASIPGLRHVIIGEHDDFARVLHVERCLGGWQPGAGMHIVSGADHFFAGCGQALQAALAAAVRDR